MVKNQYFSSYDHICDQNILIYRNVYSDYSKSLLNPSKCVSDQKSLRGKMSISSIRNFLIVVVFGQKRTVEDLWVMHCRQRAHISDNVKKCKIENHKSVTKNVHVTKIKRKWNKMWRNVMFLKRHGLWRKKFTKLHKSVNRKSQKCYKKMCMWRKRNKI